MFQRGVGIAAICLMLAACAQADAPQVGLDGKLDVRRFEDFVNGRSWQELWLESAGRRIKLVPINDELASGAITGDARVKGQWLSDEIFEVAEIDTTAAAAQELSTPTPQKRTVVVLMVNFSDDQRQPISLDKAKTDLIGGLDSVNGYLKEASFGLRELVGKVNPAGDLYGYYTLASPKSPCNPDRWKQEAIAAASAAGVNTAGYQHVMLVFPSSDQCNWGGLGEVGGSFSWFPHPYYSHSVPHELGHNLGLSHANAYDCRSADGTRVAMSDTCTSKEYADPFCAMGGNVRHFSNYAKGRVGWLADSNIKTFTAGTNTATLAPIETASSSVQVLRVYKDSPGGRARYYYLEYRRPNSGWDNFSPAIPVVNGVTIRLAQDFSRGDVTNLIDTTPGTDSYGDAPLLAGKTFRDRKAKLTIETVSVDGNQATVRVEYDGVAPIPLAPVLFKSGFEAADDTLPTWADTVDFSRNVTAYLPTLPGPEASARSEQAHSGARALMYSGTDGDVNFSFAYLKVFDVDITVGPQTELSYWLWPQQENGGFVSVDLIFSDGTALRDSGAVDQWGVRVHPAAQGLGAKLVTGQWNEVRSNIGARVAGKTIDRIVIGYDQPLRTGGYRGFLDDVVIR